MLSIKKVLLIGSNGQLGQKIREDFSPFYDLICLAREQIDLSKSLDIIPLIQGIKPDLVINCSAYTNVDLAEEEQELAYKINAIAPQKMAIACKQLSISFIHFSTDYVFSGMGRIEYKEADHAFSFNYYGFSKLEGERLIREVNGDYLIFRLAGVYDLKSKNFATTILRLYQEKAALSIVCDQQMTPTSTSLISQTILSILQNIEQQRIGNFNSIKGVYHLSSEGKTTWFGFTKELVKQMKKKSSFDVKEITAILTHQYPLPAKRPNYSILDKEKIKNTFSLKLDNWKKDLSKQFSKF